MWKQKEQIPSADLSSCSALTVTCSKDPKATQKNTHSAPSPPRAPHRNYPVSVFSNNAYVSLIHLCPRDQRLRNQTETLELDWQTIVIFLDKRPHATRADIRTWPGIDIITYMKTQEYIGCFIPAMHIPTLAGTACSLLAHWNEISQVQSSEM